MQAINTNKCPLIQPEKVLTLLPKGPCEHFQWIKSLPLVIGWKNPSNYVYSLHQYHFMQYIFSWTPLGSFLAQLPSTAHEQKCFYKKTPCVTWYLPPNPYMVEWNHVTSIFSYVAIGRVMVHSTSHHEHLGNIPTLPVTPTRKIPSPNFHIHLMRPK